MFIHGSLHQPCYQGLSLRGHGQAEENEMKIFQGQDFFLKAKAYDIIFQGQRQGKGQNFSFKAKAKTLSSKAKSKTFMRCPRGSSRPRPRPCHPRPRHTRPRPRPSWGVHEDTRGQGQDLVIQGQVQDLHEVSTRILEAKAKTLSSKAKSKTFMRCPRGSSRPRPGLENHKTVCTYMATHSVTWCIINWLSSDMIWIWISLQHV